MEKLAPKVKTENTIDRKDFMKQVGIGFGAIMLMNCLQSCSETEIPDPNPVTSTGLDITIDLNTSTYSSLITKGNFAVITANKIIVARTNDTNGTFIAVSSACTHEGRTIAYQSASNNFKCPLHGAEFAATGAVTKGPATVALKKYSTTFNETAKTLRIFEA
jgi:cytochrome b6-f complex iron-sulfur subunit